MIRILAFGNSLTAGTPGYDPTHRLGDPTSQYCYWIMKFLKDNDWDNISFDNRGVPGELARWMPARLKQLLHNTNYSYSIILGGSNDIGWQDTPDRIILYLKELWQIAGTKEVTVIACTIPPIGAVYPSIQNAQLELNRLIINNANQNENVCATDTYHALADADGLLKHEYDSGDGLHLSVEGYKRMGEEIWKSSLHPLLEKEL